MHLTIQEYNPVVRAWDPLHSQTIGPDTPPQRGGPRRIDEGRELRLRVRGLSTSDSALRVFVGDVLAASTIWADRPDLVFRPADNPDPGRDESLVCQGRLLQDWVGFSELTVDVLLEGRWRQALRYELQITAGKVKQEQFDLLFADLSELSTSLLTDVYGKTWVGLSRQRANPGDAAPVAGVKQLRDTLNQLALALRQVAAQPASRLRLQETREPVTAAQAVSERTLEEACMDPNLLTRFGRRFAFREQVSEAARVSYDIPEHRLLSGFLKTLGENLTDLRRRVEGEIDLRDGRRAYRAARPEAGGRTWWESEDLPRIKQLREVRRQVDSLERQWRQLARYKFLPPARPLGELPPSTPLIRSRRAYAAAYRVMAAHFRTFRASLDNTGLLARAKSLPVLYELWCSVRLINVLRQVLLVSESSGGPLRGGDGPRFVMEFEPDQALDFTDRAGRLVRLRYQPRYPAEAEAGGRPYGLLGPAGERTPDLSVEVFLRPGGAAAGPDEVPDLIVVMDAKYTSAPHGKKLDELRQKYGQIGRFDTGELLSRQVWALTPASPTRPADGAAAWAKHCTVDNHSFWKETFSMNAPAHGAVRTIPTREAGPLPAESLMIDLLARCGVEFTGEFPLPDAGRSL